ncbi:hypothetical protein ACSFA3_17450 [Variovorax sp. RHLX14]|uniref:hypothetical protein n=1 Tax=Variovorax sp. RHLX14 TaxID=1259731 RepID=UPI003F45CD8F
MPAHLVGRNSRNELFVAYRVNQHNAGDPKAGVEPSTVPGDDLVTQNEPAPALTTSKLAPEA